MSVVVTPPVLECLTPTHLGYDIDGEPLPVRRPWTPTQSSDRTVRLQQAHKLHSRLINVLEGAHKWFSHHERPG